jgi:hypothetical protein
MSAFFQMHIWRKYKIRRNKIHPTDHNGDLPAHADTLFMPGGIRIAKAYRRRRVYRRQM